MPHYPSIEELTKNPDPNNLLEVHRSVFSILSDLLLAIASALVVLIFIKLKAHFNFSLPIPYLSNISIYWLFLIPGILTLEVLRKYHDDLYVFSKNQLKHLSGRLSLSYNIPAVNYIDIRAITVQQDILGRIFNYGTVVVGTGGVDGNELLLTGVRAPWKLGEVIDAMRNFSKKELGRDSDKSD